MSSLMGPLSQAVDYFESHLNEDIGIGDGAAAAGFSLFHFCRVFNRLTHLSPYEYLLRRRLAEAARSLVNSRKSITEIALDFCFHNLETFSRAFKRQFAMQPNQWRRQGVLDPRRVMPPITLPYLQFLDNTTPIQFEMMRLEPRMLYALSGFVSPERQETTAIRQRLISQGDIWTAAYWQIDRDKNELFYLAGCEQEGKNTPLKHNLPGGSYAHFQVHGESQQMRWLADYGYHVWLFQNGAHLAGDWDLECYDHVGQIHFFIPIHS